MRRFHHILLVILVDVGIVQVMDSKRVELEVWADMQEMLQR